MRPSIYLFAVFAAAFLRSLQAEETPFPTLEHPHGFDVSPLSPSAASLPLPTAENALVSEPADLSGLFPSFFVSGTARHSFGDVYAVRGLTNGRLLTEPSVGLYIDGVPAGDAFTYAEPLYAIDRVDFYRSPQTTLFGLGAAGGILDIETRHADPKEWHGEVSGLYGDFRTVEHRLWLAGPLIQDQLTLELAGFKGTTQGFIDNTFLRGRRDDRDTAAGRAVLTWTPRPDWEIVAGVDGSRYRDGGSRFTPLGGDPFQVRSDEPGALRSQQLREWLSIAKKFETWEVRSITSHSRWKADPIVQDTDFSPRSAEPLSEPVPRFAPLSFFTGFPSEGTVSRLTLQEETWSQEIRFQSLPGASPEEPWWKAGFFWQQKRAGGQRDNVRGEEDEPTSVIPLAPSVYSIDGFAGFPGFTFSVPNLEVANSLANVPVTNSVRFAQLSENWAGYLDAGRRWGWFEIMGGLRADYTRKTFDRTAITSGFDFISDAEQDAQFREAIDLASQASLQLPPGIPSGKPVVLPPDFTIRKLLTRYSGEEDDFNITPAVGVVVHLSEHVQLFARSSYVVKPGGFNPLFGNQFYARYGREQIWATELGLRASAWHGRLLGQLTGYINTIKGYQLDLTDRNFLIVNAGRARSYGAELEAAYQLLPGLAVSGHASYNQTELTEALPGQQAPYVPQYTAFAALDYAHHTGFRAHAEYVAIGDTDYQPLDLPRYRQGGYGLVNGRIGYERGHYGVYLFGRNLTDTKRLTQISEFSGAGSTGEPRVLGVMALLKF